MSIFRQWTIAVNKFYDGSAFVDVVTAKHEHLTYIVPLKDFFIWLTGKIVETEPAMQVARITSRTVVYTEILAGKTKKDQVIKLKDFFDYIQKKKILTSTYEIAKLIKNKPLVH